MLKTNFALDTELLEWPKIDVHSHIVLKDGKLNLEQLETMLDDCQLLGIRTICVSIPFVGIGSKCQGPDIFSAANDVVINATERYPEKVLGYAFIHPGFHQWAENEVQRCLEFKGIIGIKLYHQYLFNDPVVVSIVSSVARKNALILLHQGKVMDSNSHQIEPLISDGFHIAVLAKQVPTAKIICGHIFGGGDWEWTAKALKDIPSVYIDTSGSVIDDGAIEFIAGQIGTERLLFATDLSIEEGVGKILGCNLSKNVKKAVFSENFHNLLTKIKK